MRKFKAESQRLLDLMINSIYTNKEIFLRELISNASDAIDKLYFMSLTDTSIQVGKDELVIGIAYDEEKRTLTISDGGIGMNDDDLDHNLGVIAHSGSLEFKDSNLKPHVPASDASEDGDDAVEVEESATAHDDVDIIGQFGVGFYSAFMVASKVQVVTRRFGEDQAWEWTSNGVEGYNITRSERASHGTDITLYLKDDTDDEDYSRFASEYGLTGLIKRYSNYIRYPIRMAVTKSRMLPKPEDAGEDYRPEYEQYTEVETINSMIPIWKRRKSEVADGEYDDFYKSTFHDYTDPVRVLSLHTEGKLSYDALMFIPGQQPFDLYSKDYQKGLALYSSGVMIMEKCEDLLPDYFGFIKGVVDSADLTLNISRETLQQDAQLSAIARRLEKKIKSELASIRDDDRETYEKVFSNFGRGIKYGIYSSYGMKGDLLGDLLLFYSAKEQKLVTLDEYVDAAPVDAGSIFYAAGDSVDQMARMPMVKSVLDKGYDVLLCTQDVDEFCLQALRTYEEKALKNVAGGDLGIETDDEKEAAEEISKENLGLLSAMEEALEDKVSKVAISTRLTDEPVCLTAAGPISLDMEKRLSKVEGNEDIKTERVLEVNAANPIFETLKSAWEDDDRDKIDTYTKLLYNQALLMEGLTIDDPTEFAQAVCKLMV